MKVAKMPSNEVNATTDLPNRLDEFLCPATHNPLKIRQTAGGNLDPSGRICVERWLESETGETYPIVDGIPDFTYPKTSSADPNKQVPGIDLKTVIDNFTDWIMAVFDEDEARLRNTIIDLLELTPTARVLEIGCGTAGNTILLRDRLHDGVLFSQDISMELVRYARHRVTEAPKQSQCGLRWYCGDAAWLPFSDGYFDAVLTTGGINQFEDIPRAIAEMNRVTRVGGKVVIADEGLAHWWRDTEMGRMLTNSNPLLANEPPLASLPISARDVSLRWLLGNSYYALDYRVSDTPPFVDLDLPHKGVRGGSLRSRYYGMLEGVTPDTRKLAEEAAQKAGLSMHDWLETLVRDKAQKVLEAEPKCDQ